MLRSLFFVLLVACNADHSMVSSELNNEEQASDQSANRQQEVSQTREQSLSFRQVSGGCSERDLGSFVAENYVRYTVNPTVAKRKTLAGDRKLRHTVTMGRSTGREVFVQPSRPRYRQRFIVADGVTNGNNTEFTLTNDPLGSGNGCHITIDNYRRDSYLRQFCIGSGVTVSGQVLSIPSAKLNNVDTIFVSYSENMQVQFQRHFQLQGRGIDDNSLRVNNRDKYFIFDADNNTLTLRGPNGERLWQNTHQIFEGTNVVITYSADQLSYDLIASADVFDLSRTRCSVDNSAINCTVRDNKVHFQADDFSNGQQVVVSLQLRTTRKVPLGKNYVEDSVVLTFDGNNCEDDELTIDADNNILIDTAAAKSACPMLAEFDDNDESITVSYKTFSPNQDKLVIEKSFFSRHQHNAACYELWVNDVESESYSVSAKHTATPNERLPFDARVVFKVFLLQRSE